MKIGVVFPQIEIGPDPGVVREYVQTAEGVGYDHLLAYDHVLGAGLANRPDWRGPYSSESLFHEVFVLFGYLAAITTRLELVTGILILPQRQTALVAKQAAEVDVLSGGRLRLGVGIGWNDVEYVALNEDFHNRGRRMEEQIELLRALWTQEVVDYQGRWHVIPEAGLNPLPVQRPIPLWIGGYVDAAMERTGRLGDGWFPRGLPGDAVEHSRAIVNQAAARAGRDPRAIGMEGRITLAAGAERQWAEQTAAWRQAGATHLSINTMGAGRSPREHIAAIRRYREVMGEA
jgi:probable F420-dependent oxidoreductase